MSNHTKRLVGHFKSILQRMMHVAKLTNLVFTPTLNVALGG